MQLYAKTLLGRLRQFFKQYWGGIVYKKKIFVFLTLFVKISLIKAIILHRDTFVNF